MQTATAERYLDLYQRFGSGTGTGTPVEVTLEELADTLHCTTRNVKLVLRKMEEDGWIEWLPGRGRGNRSRIVFQSEKETLLLDMARKMAQRGDYRLAFELIHAYGEGTNVKEQFTEWLDLHFGYRTETMDDRRSFDTLRLPVHTPLRTLDPAEVYHSFDAHMIRQIYDRLVQFDPAACRVMPALAHAWERNEDATVWHFHLRKGVRFHHGREMTADDVLFSLNRLRNGHAHSWMLRTLAKLEAAGPRTVRIELNKPNRIFHRFMCSAAASILPRDLVEKEGERFFRNPVGTGPFMITEWTSDRLVMAAHAGYFQGRAHLDGVVIGFLPEEHGKHSCKHWEKLVLDRGQQDPYPDPDEEWQSIETLNKGCSLLTWNLNKEGPQRMPQFRRAVELLIDRNALIRELGGEGSMYPARGFRLNEANPYWEDRTDPRLAAALLEEAGYDGTPVTIYTRRYHVEVAEWISRRCAELGIRIRVREADPAGTIAEENFQWDAVLYGVVLPEDDVCEIETYEQTGSYVREHLDPAMQAWIRDKVDEALEAPGVNERRAVLEQIEGRLRDEAYVHFLLHIKTNTAYQPGIKGVAMSPLGWIDFRNVWVQNGNG